MDEKRAKKTLYWGNKVLYPIQNCRKIRYDDPTAYPKLGMATYTKEIVIINFKYSLANIINI